MATGLTASCCSARARDADAVSTAPKNENTESVTEKRKAQPWKDCVFYLPHGMG
jgi:hypothetical protein